jgi:uncharacterized membrane protein YoaK (UPF0700 family)
MFINPNAPHSSLKPINFVLWFILTFQAGAINVGGYLSCKRFVTHVTGFATHVGVDLAAGAFLEAMSMIMVPAFFLIGCMTSALLIDRRKHLRKKPYYTAAFLFSAICFFLITFLGVLGYFGKFGETTNSTTTFILLSTMSYLSGVQNSMISLASGLLVRTTHLTGITTDLGVGFMRMLYPNVEPAHRELELKMNLLRFGTILSFILGSIIAGVVFSNLNYFGFLLPTIISSVLAHYSWQHHLRVTSPNTTGVPT